MIRRGVAIVLTLLVLAGCAPVGTLEVEAQRHPQQKADRLTDEQLATFSEQALVPESTRLLGTEDGRDFYVGSTDESICLIIVDEKGPTSGCSSGLPVKVSLPGVFGAELWFTAGASHDQSGHWIGDHLWLADRP